MILSRLIPFNLKTWLGENYAEMHIDGYKNIQVISLELGGMYKVAVTAQDVLTGEIQLLQFTLDGTPRFVQNKHEKPLQLKVPAKPVETEGYIISYGITEPKKNPDEVFCVRTTRTIYPNYATAADVCRKWSSTNGYKPTIHRITLEA